MKHSERGGGSHVDLDLHGLVGLRLVDPGPSDVATVRRQLGELPRRQLDREPEIRIRFVDRISRRGAHYRQDGKSGFRDDGLLLASPGGASRWTVIPIESLGNSCEFVAERGARTIPLLQEAVKLSALRRGLAAVHASAFEHQGVGVLVAGGAHGGKTSALLAFTQHGAEFVGEELVLLSGDGSMYGCRMAMEVSGWQLEQIPDLYRAVSPWRRVAWWAMRGAQKLSSGQVHPTAGALSRGFLARLLRAVDRRLRVHLPSDVACRNVDRCVSRASRIMFGEVHEALDIWVERVEAETMLQRLQQLGQHDRLALRGYYAAHLARFPSRRNQLIESADALEAGVLRQALVAKGAYVVHHPRPVRLGMLFDAMAPFCGTETDVEDERLTVVGR